MASNGVPCLLCIVNLEDLFQITRTMSKSRRRGTRKNYNEDKLATISDHYFPLGCKVNGAFGGLDRWYAGVVIGHNQDGTYVVKYYDDGQEEEDT